MSQLELAFTEIQKLPPIEQNEFATWILAELRSEERWTKLFAKSGDILSRIADEALTEYRANKTEELDPEQL